MTILEIKTITQIAGNNRKYHKKELYLKCDECLKEWKCSETSVKSRALKNMHHFCSKQCSWQSEITKNNRKKTCLAKFGVEYFVGSKKFRKYMVDYCMENYGVPSLLEAPEILKKIEDTCLEKYGQKTFVGSKEHNEKIDRKQMSRKAWNTKLKNGFSMSSKIEDKFYELICKEFKIENILRHEEVIGQYIDFYIKTLDLYIQFDGVYWHGLNRDILEIKNSTRSQDKSIYEQYLRDQKLNKYMKENNKKLLRITDEQFKKLSEEDIIKIIKEVR